MIKNYTETPTLSNSCFITDATSGKRGVIFVLNDAGKLWWMLSGHISIKTKGVENTHTTTPASIQASLSGMIGFPLTSNGLSKLNAQRSMAIWMNMTWFAKLKPTQILLALWRQSRPAMSSKSIPSSKSKRDMTRAMSVWRNSIDLSSLVQKPFGAEFFEIREDLRISDRKIQQRR